MTPVMAPPTWLHTLRLRAAGSVGSRAKLTSEIQVMERRRIIDGSGTTRTPCILRPEILRVTRSPPAH